MNIITVFLYSLIDQIIYIKLLYDYRLSDKVALLNKALYNLKQSSHLWYKTSFNHLVLLKFWHSELNYSIFLKNSIIITVYVNNLLLIDSSKSAIQCVKNKLNSVFNIMNLRGIGRRNTTEPQPDQLSKFWIEQILRLTHFYKPSTQLVPITHTHGGGPQLPFHLKISRCVSQKPKQHFRHQHRHTQRVFENSELTVFFALISSWIHTITAFWYLYCSQSCWTV